MHKLTDGEIIQHFGEDPAKYYGAVTPPIVQTSTFKFNNLDEFFKGLENEQNVHAYTRGNNPTCDILEKKLAMLEGAERAKCFGSGQGALAAVFLSLVNAGDEVLIVNNVYGPTTSLLQEMERFNLNLKIVYVEMAEEIEQYISEKTKIIYFESPSSYLMKVLDVEVIVQTAKKHGLLTVMDNTWNTPLYFKAASNGVDVSVHTLSKYIGGHSDIIGGVVITSEILMSEIFRFGHQFLGATLSPFNAWLALRGLRSLEARLQFQAKTTDKVVEFLKTQEKVLKIYHPLTLEGKDKEIFERQNLGYTSLLSVDIDIKDYEELNKFISNLNLFTIGVSWGGFESLVFPVYDGKNEEYLDEYKKPLTLVRLYLGMENVDDIIQDLKNGLDSL